MYTEHPCFETPNDSTKIWRYMNFSKLLSLLNKSHLFFPNALKLAENDPYEGSYAQGNLDYDLANDPAFKEWRGLPKAIKSDRTDTKNLIRRGIYINSWHMSEHESAAMWKCYAENKDGMAIQSTVGKLKAAIKDNPKETYIGKINYIDYETSIIKKGSFFWNFIHKRMSFEHEKELRVIFINDELFDPAAKLKKVSSIPIKTEDLIEKIFISPTAPNWTKELLESILEKYKLKIGVNKSDLNSDGLW